MATDNTEENGMAVRLRPEKKEPPARSGGKIQKKARVVEPFEVLCEKHIGKSRSMSGKKY